jgi:hypothetical protein
MGSLPFRDKYIQIISQKLPAAYYEKRTPPQRKLRAAAADKLPYSMVASL